MATRERIAQVNREEEASGQIWAHLSTYPNKKKSKAKSKALSKAKNEKFLEHLQKDKSPRKKQVGSYF